MANHFLKNQEGAVAVLVGIMIAALMGFVGLALDIGNLMVTKTEMQNAVDAAACAGALALTNYTTATTQATTFVQNNGFPSITPTVSFTQDTIKNSSNYPEINVSISQNVPTLVMGALGISSVQLSAKAEAVQISSSSSGPFSYTLFSNTSLQLSGNSTVNGSVHSNGNLHTDLDLTGNVDITGNAEGYNGVMASGNVTVGGAISANSLSNIVTTGNVSYGSENANAQYIAMPDFSSQLNALFPNMTQYSTSQTWSGNIPNLTNSVYVNGTVTLSGNINSTGAIVATGNITITGDVTLGSNQQICLYSLNGNVTVSGNVSYNSNSSAIIFAPNGSVTMSGNSTFNGSIVANAISASGNVTYNYPSVITALPVSKFHAKLIS